MSTANEMKSITVQRIVNRCKTEEKKAKEIASELKISGYKVSIASVCMCEKTAFFDTPVGLNVRQFA